MACRRSPAVSDKILYNTEHNQQTEQSMADAAKTQVTFSDEERHFLTRYLGPQTDAQLEERCQKLLSQAQQYEVYTTMAGLNWLLPQVQTLPAYRALSKRFGDPYPPVVCELGASVGTDVRQMILDGLPANNIIASDVIAGYWDLGLDFFSDRDKIQVKARPCNAAAPPETPIALDEFREKIDACYSLLVLHVFNQQTAKYYLERQFKLLAPGGICFGTTCGARSSRPWPVRGSDRWLFGITDLCALLESVGFKDVVVEETVLSHRMKQMRIAREATGPLSEDMLVLSFQGVKVLPEWANC